MSQQPQAEAGSRKPEAQTQPAFSKWRLLALIASFIFVSDQVSKYLAVEHLTAIFPSVNARSLPDKIGSFVSQRELLERGMKRPDIKVVDSWWQWHYTQNRGAAFGVFASQGEKFRVPFFHLVTIAAVIFILSYYRKLEEKQRYLQISLALLLGGALGNGLDRVLRGYVIDFIDWHWFDPSWLNPNHHWPTFNIADCGVSIGLVLLFLEMLIVKRPAEAPSPGKRTA